MTLQELQALRTPMTLKEGIDTFGDDVIDDDTISLYVYDYANILGYIECQKDGMYFCVVTNMSIYDSDLTKVEQFLLDTWFNT